MQGLVNRCITEAGENHEKWKSDFEKSVPPEVPEKTPVTGKKVCWGRFYETVFRRNLRVLRYFVKRQNAERQNVEIQIVDMKISRNRMVRYFILIQTYVSALS
jgi:hypothetical protein